MTHLFGHLALKWGLALIYLALCFGLIFLFPAMLRPYLGGAVLLYFVYTFLTQERSCIRAEDCRSLTRWDVPDYEQFLQSLSAACGSLGIREPVWTVVEAEQPNAWACGGRTGAVAFTTGLLKSHPVDEILAIAGHELAHLKARDSLPAVIGSAWLRVVGEIAFWLRKASQHRGGNMYLDLLLAVGSAFALILDLALALVSWLGRIVLAHRSRHEEHMADMVGARLKSATTMIAALERLESASANHHRPEYPRWSPAWIARQMNATHPRTELRVQFLRQAAERGEVLA